MQLLKKIALTLSSLLLIALIALIVSPELQGKAQAVYCSFLKVDRTFRAGTVVAGENAFTTTQIRDTVVLTGALATDYYFLTPESDTSQTPLSYIAKADTLIVLRKASGTSGLGYSYLRLRP